MPRQSRLDWGPFFDAGALNDSLSLSNMKYSAGVSGEWLSPFGALAVSAAYPLNSGNYTYDTYNPYIGNYAHSEISQSDQTQFFQFNFGQNF